MGWNRAQGLLSAAAFVVLLMGTNAPTPLLPIYRDYLGFSALVITMTYSIYVVALVTVLFLATSPSIARRAPFMLLFSLFVAVAADGLLATGSQIGILAGRALSGVAGGIGTGAAAALTVAVLGDRGRALSVTGNLAGAILGTSASQLILSLVGAKAITLNFALHAGLCLVLILPLAFVLFQRRRCNATIFLKAKHPAGSSLSPLFMRSPGALLTGCIAWVLISASIVFLPSYFADHSMPLVQALGIPLLLSSSLASQLASPWLRQHAGSISGIWAMLLGIGCIFFGAEMSASNMSLGGFCFVGFGAGLAYRSSLMMIALEAPPVSQGRISSLYAGITYAIAAVVILLSGIMTRHISMTAVTQGIFATIVFLLPLVHIRAPKLRDLRAPEAGR